MRQNWERIVDFWNTGNSWIRLAIVLIVGWPVAITLAKLWGLSGDATLALALMPAVAWLLLWFVIPPMLSVLVMILPVQPFDDIRFLGQIRLPSRAERLRVLKGTLKFLTRVAGIETAFGIYLAVVPVRNDPGLILWLVAITIAFVLLWYGGIRNKWLTWGFVTAFLVITAIFFFKGRNGVWTIKERMEKWRADQIVAAQAAWVPKEFTLNAGEEKPTVLNGPGTLHRIQANKTWIAIAADNTGKVVEYPMPAGASRWGGSEPEDLLWVRGLEDGTTLRFEKVSK